MTENKPNPTVVDEGGSADEPDDLRWYVQRMYDLAVEPIESGPIPAVK